LAFPRDLDLDGDQVSRLIVAPQMNTFVLHPRLAADTIVLGRLRLSLLLMMNDVTYPWFILVPERMEAREIFELAQTDRLALTEEVALLSRALCEVFRPDKLNIATLGNLVPQLHVHVIARFRSDAAWPAPVWGKADARPYAEAALRTMRARMADGLGGSLLPAH
jgi:diadenosine tetraphosphate (Ap4A) HIT family hydrolase